MLHHLVIAIRRYLNQLITIPFPQLISGEGQLSAVTDALQQANRKKVLIVSDKELSRLGFTSQLSEIVAHAAIEFYIFDDVTPDPSIETVAQGAQCYQEQQCDSVIALGGGSVIDCAKAIAASVVKNKPIKALAGLFKIRKPLPLFIAVPTTAGTGSEGTLVAVISDKEQQKKFTVVDPCLVPKIAILDPLLMLGLPAYITAHTGIDALTHAIESYIGRHSNSLTKDYSVGAIKRIFEYLPLAFTQGNNVKARSEMALASYYAGLAFTRTSVGYVHAIAHQLGAIYHIPHGLANAVVLTHVLDFSFDKAYPAYADIAYQTGLANKTDDSKQAAMAFVEKVTSLAKQLNIPETFQELKAEDIDDIAQRAIKEAYCDYPVPKVMSVNQCRIILEKLLP
ncbi:alcohol dehydrogenase [Thalassotalea insulae]|uniref:Alcohol dehydrogenase n=1 Tax=Thalassotalea insulae TaxID=2056778 RepID=A0ABQ6GXR5_9GAMM|nr:iron-containing alcohol dehydrogenase [Thalassotalea insulae]GLX79426.1 alcohol dehydrogenase [Thalassotalea insulae]